MRRWAPYVAFMLPMISSITPAHAADNHEWQFWTTEAVEHKVTEQWTAKLEAEFYFGDDMSDLFYRHYDIGLSRKLVPWFGVGVNYRFVEQEKNDEWAQESQPHINGTFYWGMGKLRASDRNRLENRIPEDGDDFWRYRNKLRVGMPLEGSQWNVEPYVANEVFIDSKVEEVNQNRAQAGIASSVVDWLKIELYYMFLSSKSVDRWTDANVLGTSFLVTF